MINEERIPPGDHAGRYNSPLSDDIGILMPNDNTHSRDFVLLYRNSTLVRIYELHRGYDPYGILRYFFMAQMAGTLT